MSQGIIFYCFRHHLFNEVTRSLKRVKTVQVTNEQPAAYQLYMALGELGAGQFDSAIGALNRLLDSTDFALAASLALLHAHRDLDDDDDASVGRWKSRLATVERALTADDEAAFYYAAVCSYLLNAEVERGSNYLKRAMVANPDSAIALALHGWMQLKAISNSDAAAGQDVLKEALQHFQAAARNAKHKENSLPANMGVCECLIRLGQHDQAGRLLNAMSSDFVGYWPVQMMQAKLALARRDWDAARETCQEISLAASMGNDHSSGVQIELVSLLHSLCRDGKVTDFVVGVEDVLQLVERCEPDNFRFTFRICNLISCLMTTADAELYEKVDAFLTKVASKSHLTASDQVDLANFYRSVGRSDAALSTVRSAMKRHRGDSSSSADDAASLLVLIRFLLEGGQADEASRQATFLEQLVDADTGGVFQSPLYLYVKALMLMNSSGTSTATADRDATSNGEPNSARLRSEQANAISLLNRAAHRHVALVSAYPFGIDYLAALNPDFIGALLKLMMTFVSTSTGLDSRRDNAGATFKTPILQQCERLLVEVQRALPSLPEFQLLMAQVKYSSGELAQAQKLLRSILDDSDAGSITAALLSARISVEERQYQEALKTLESCLSHNFRVRDNPHYWLVTAKVQQALKQTESARVSLEKAAELYRQSDEGSTVSSAGPLASESSSAEEKSDRLGLLLELASIYASVGQRIQARSLLQQARDDTAGTVLEQRVMLGEARFMILFSPQQADEIVQLLRGVPVDGPYGADARDLIGDVLLNLKRDEKNYVQLYRADYDRSTDKATATLTLSQAYMRIPDPDAALGVLEAAVKSNPRNLHMVASLGALYVRCHYYKRAVNYYEITVRRGAGTPEALALLPELVRLLIDMRNYDRAEKTIDEHLPKLDRTNFDELHVSVRLRLAMATVRRTLGDMAGEREQLLAARQEQLKLLRRSMRERPDEESVHSVATVALLIRLAASFEAENDYAEVKSALMSAMAINRANTDLILAYARVCLLSRDTGEAVRQLTSILGGDVASATATTTPPQVALLLAEAAFRRRDYAEVTRYARLVFSASAERRIDFDALVGALDLLRRSGALIANAALWEALLERIESRSQMGDLEPGVRFCRGLYARYSGDSDRAIELLSGLVDEPRWGPQAAVQLVMLALKWDVEAIGVTSIYRDDDPNLSLGATKLSPDEVNDLSRLLKTSIPESLIAEDARYAIMNELPKLYSVSTAHVSQFHTVALNSIAKWVGIETLCRNRYGHHLYVVCLYSRTAPAHDGRVQWPAQSMAKSVTQRLT